MTMKALVQLTLGSARFDVGITHLSVHLNILPGVNQTKITLPAEAALNATSGDDAAVAVDQGNGWQTLFKGKVRGKIVNFQNQQIILADASADLAAYRPATTFQAQEAAAIAKTLASDVGISLQTPPPPFGLPNYVAHDRISAAEHLAKLAKLTGTLATLSATGSLQFVPLNVLVPTSALKFGRDFGQWSTTHTPAPISEWIASGHGPAGIAQAPNAHLQTKASLPNNNHMGKGVHRLVEPLLKTPLAAQTTQQSLQSHAQLFQIRIHSHGICQPKLRPGDVVQIQDLPGKQHPGEIVVTSLDHRWSSQTGLETHLKGWAVPSGGLLGALGGLL